MSETTPMMRQYNRIKTKHRDKILFFRLGDFYEMFQSDAKEASRILGLTLTARQGIPMCGIPYHAAKSYIPRLLEAGRKVAICEQTTLPESGKGIAQRSVVEILTPGTVFDADYLKQGDNNYIASFSQAPGEKISASFIDVSTGELSMAAYRINDARVAIRSELYRYSPGEILVQESLLDGQQWLASEISMQNAVINRFPDWYYSSTSVAKRLTAILKLHSLKSYNLDAESPELSSIGALLNYVEENAGRPIIHIHSLTLRNTDDFLVIDSSSQRNLELVRNINDGGEQQSLFKILDQTKTSMGKRLLKQWILRPLIAKEQILKRQKMVSALYRDQLLLNRCREILAGTLDLVRLSARISMEKAHPRDLVAVRRSLENHRQLFELLSPGPIGEQMAERHLPMLEKAQGLIEKAIVDDPPAAVNDGGIIRPGYNREVDELRSTESNAEQLMADYLEEEKNASGISNLKIKNNKVIGYYLEVSKAQIKNVPSRFESRQSLVNAERFITPALRDLAERISGARERLMEREQHLFAELRRSLANCVTSLQSAACWLAMLDCVQSFSYQATLKGYTQPEIFEDNRLSVSGGRHPVVEAFTESGSFIPNDLEFKPGNSEFFALITGPNMAGKSTFLRQNALIVLMAQTGSFVPADQACIGIADKIFCRVGASDNLSRGESTFLVEMSETAHILRQATQRSLVVMDEVGRGTSTQDGLAIAWSVCEYLLNNMQARTLFATHFHQLSDIDHPKLKNLSLMVREDDGEILFLNKVVNGPSNNSYGLHVAQIAGIPEEVIFRAGEILEEISKSGGKMSIVRSETKKSTLKLNGSQRGLFGQDEMVIQEIKNLDINAMSPLEALNQLQKLQRDLAN